MEMENGKKHTVCRGKEWKVKRQERKKAGVRVIKSERMG